MSKEQAAQLIADVASDHRLLRQFYVDVPTGSDVSDLVVAIAARNGYSFTAEEYRSVLADLMRHLHVQAGLTPPEIHLTSVAGVRGLPLVPPLTQTAALRNL